MSAQQELDQLRDAHRRTALAVACQRLRDDPSLTPARLVLYLRTEMRHSKWFLMELIISLALRRKRPVVRSRLFAPHISQNAVCANVSGPLFLIACRTG